MKKKYGIIGIVLVVLIGVGLIISCKKHISIDKSEDGTAISIIDGADGSTSISIIGGADGPTSIFLAGKLGGNDMNQKAVTAITMDKAKKIFDNEGDYMIVDVRSEEEFAEGHIPGAINIDNESIGTEKPEALPDMDKVIYVYCRSGQRSKVAAAKLSAMGYTNIIECGGILDWTGELEK